MSTETMGEILKINPRYSQSSDAWKTPFSRFDDTTKNHAAVAVVLELIKADVSSSSNVSMLSTHLNNLPLYTEQVLAVLNEQ
ncbi:hypothetical protein [Vibrio campbellii]|uniref:hypothetical protein n=1 Tax=Vibrio campbellii TaxID=680 RepID=UPI0005EE1B58|nr:hypothetical protein [Vibrio campbellii]